MREVAQKDQRESFDSAQYPVATGLAGQVNDWTPFIESGICGIF